MACPARPLLTVADLHRSGNGKIAHNREQKGRATTGILVHTTQNTTAAENTREKSAQEKTTFRHKRETAVYSVCAGSNPSRLPKTHQRLSAARRRGNRGGGAAWQLPPLFHTRPPVRPPAGLLLWRATDRLAQRSSRTAAAEQHNKLQKRSKQKSQRAHYCCVQYTHYTYTTLYYSLYCTVYSTYTVCTVVQY